MTGSAAALEDWTRWLGVALAVWGALLANPAATDHALRATGREVVAALRRILPKRGQRTHRVGTDRSTAWAVEAAHVERTYDADEWADADAEGRLGILAFSGGRLAGFAGAVVGLYGTRSCNGWGTPPKYRPHDDYDWHGRKPSSDGDYARRQAAKKAAAKRRNAAYWD
ncbi:hypothetical protein [Terrabacter sp. MAHUQ-38]|uniref:hypothetical protein n=1 Tax=unclassified Terrabacter TaxID=2630222 RepID=UPI00165E3234|nr:hypothetical protein [Terrabacter sp. MAHUQ-38]MBC9822393.1 hypothetical protein [Terrabacter sp. MAHUQ-38]